MVARGAGSRRAPGALAAWSPRTGRHGAALVGGPMMANRWHGDAGDLAGPTGRTSGKEEGAGAHQKGGSTMRQREWRQAAAFNGGGVAPVVADECGEVLQLEGDKGVGGG
jgi:hypothetical protein